MRRNNPTLIEFLCVYQIRKNWTFLFRLAVAIYAVENEVKWVRRSIWSNESQNNSYKFTELLIVEPIKTCKENKSCCGKSKNGVENLTKRHAKHELFYQDSQSMVTLKKQKQHEKKLFQNLWVDQKCKKTKNVLRRLKICKIYKSTFFNWKQNINQSLRLTELRK